MIGSARWGERLVSLAVFAGLAGLWQVLSLVYTAEAQPGEPMVAGWQVLFTRTFLSLADYWGGGFGVPTVADGAERSYLAAALSVASHLAYTLARLAVGLALGGGIGFALGLAVSFSRWSRGLVEWPVHFLRALPLLAMVPLFQLWFGATFLGQSLFAAYGVGVIVFAGTVNAVRNVPQIYIDNARLFGASRMRVYQTVILPAILPGLFVTLRLNLFAAWMVVLIAEAVGVGSGLGQIVMMARNTFNSTLVFFTMTLIGLLGFLLDQTLRWVQMRLLWWVAPGR